MKLKELDRAIVFYNQIKSIDNDIIKIEKMIVLALNGTIKSSFDLKIEDLAKPENESKKNVLDEDGFIKSEFLNNRDKEEREENPVEYIKAGFMSFLSQRMEIGDKKENHKIHNINYSISENVTVKLLGILLLDKQEERKVIVGRLQKFGIEL